MTPQGVTHLSVTVYTVKQQYTALLDVASWIHSLCSVNSAETWALGGLSSSQFTSPFIQAATPVWLCLEQQACYYLKLAAEVNFGVYIRVFPLCYDEWVGRSRGLHSQEKGYSGVGGERRQPAAGEREVCGGVSELSDRWHKWRRRPEKTGPLFGDSPV